MEHTFQQRDRVVVGDATKDAYKIPRCGEAGSLNRVLDYGYEIVLDKKELNRSDGIWHVSKGDLRHDTNLRKGDWVRYEQTDEAIGTPQAKGQIGEIESIWDCYANVRFPGLFSDFLLANLVKIQPSKEGEMYNDHTGTQKQMGAMQERQEDAIELGIQEKIRLLERNLEKAKCCLETYRDLKKFIHPPHEDDHGTR